MTEELKQPPAETPADFGTDKRALWKRWLAEIDLYERQYDKWQRRGRKIVKRYRDERETENNIRKFNILWSNIEVLKPAVYARPPKPDVQRRFKDSDPVGKAAATVLERCLSYHIDYCDLDSVLKKIRDDYLLVGRGTSWERYDPVWGEDQVGEDGQNFKQVIGETVPSDYVFWEDFGHTPARTWDEVDAVWRRVYMNREQLVARFGKKGKTVKLDHKPENMSREDCEKHGEVFKRAVVYEIWSKTDKRAIWIARGYHWGPLDVKDDPLKLENFFPCPRPFFGNLTTDTLIPLPDYAQYQDQADELDELTARIGLLLEALKVAGVYDASIKEDITRLILGRENTLIPVSSWAMFAEKGGLDGAIDWLPLDQIVMALEKLYLAREQTLNALMQISGLSDIVRGDGDPNETATAQKIKGQFASMRLQDRQSEAARYARDILRIKSEIIAEQFSPETLAAMSGIQMPMTEQERNAPMVQWQQQVQQMQMQPQMEGQPQEPPPQPEIEPASWEAIVALLRNDKLRSFRIDIETDSTIALDEQMEKESATELMGVATPFFEQMGLAAAQMPALLPLMGETFMQVIRRFKLGPNIEETFEHTMQSLQETAAQPKPDPEQQKAEAEAQARQQELDIKKQEAQLDAQREQQRLNFEMQKAQLELQAEIQKMRMEMGLKVREAELDQQLKLQESEQERAIRQDEAAQDLQLNRERATQEQVIARQQAKTDQKLAAQKAKTRP